MLGSPAVVSADGHGGLLGVFSVEVDGFSYCLTSGFSSGEVV